MLGTLAFVIFINDLDECTRLVTIMNKFADDTKVGHSVQSADDRDILQECIDKLTDWTNTWSMMFNVQKCKVLHSGRNNQKFQYTYNEHHLKRSSRSVI